MKKNLFHRLFFLPFLFLTFVGYSQSVTYASDEGKNILLNKGWKFHNGHDENWNKVSFDDSSWDTLNPELSAATLKRINYSGSGWFRLHLKLDSTLVSQSEFSLSIKQLGASEIYLDGKLLMVFGTVGNSPETEIRFEPSGIPVVLQLIPGKEHLIAIRFSNYQSDVSYSDDGSIKAGFTALLVPSNEFIPELIETRERSVFYLMLLFGFFIALGISHLLIYLFYRQYRSNLYYFLFIVLLSYFPLSGALALSLHNINVRSIVQLLIIVDIPLFFTFFLAFVYSAFYEKFPKQFWIFLSVGLIVTALIFFDVFIGTIIVAFLIVGVAVEVIRVIIVAIRNKKRGSRIIGLGVLLLAVFVLSFIILVAANGGLKLDGTAGTVFILILVASIVCLPICMSIHLAREFAQTNRSLSKQLKEVELLSIKSIEQEKEKQRLLESEKERLEIQVKERTSEITEQKKIIEEKNKDITDSIHYAKKIQDAMLPAKDVTEQLFPENFILFQPKDIVSGDFYWIAENKGFRFIAAADCTGHGVPGALMSMTGNNFLNQLVLEKNLSSTAEILTELDLAIRKSLKQERSDVESKDGMDIAICCFNSDLTEIVFSGANRPLWIVRKNELLEFKANKRSIGGSQTENVIPFSETKISLEKNDCIYMFSDGFADQFGGPEGKKFMTKRMKELLVAIHTLSMNDQKTKLENEMKAWTGELTQVDDLLVIGIRSE